MNVMDVAALLMTPDLKSTHSTDNRVCTLHATPANLKILRKTEKKCSSICEIQKIETHASAQ